MTTPNAPAPAVTPAPETERCNDWMERPFRAPRPSGGYGMATGLNAAMSLMLGPRRDDEASLR